MRTSAQCSVRSYSLPSASSLIIPSYLLSPNFSWGLTKNPRNASAPPLWKRRFLQSVTYDFRSCKRPNCSRNHVELILKARVVEGALDKAQDEHWVSLFCCHALILTSSMTLGILCKGKKICSKLNLLVADLVSGLVMTVTQIREPSTCSYALSVLTGHLDGNPQEISLNVNALWQVSGRMLVGTMLTIQRGLK